MPGIVELDVFSGMPNPVWALSEADTAAFQEKVGRLGPTTPGEWENPLGYRGFIVNAGDDVVLVQAGRVQVRRGDDRTFLADPDRALERWLYGTAAGAIDESVASVVEVALRR